MNTNLRNYGLNQLIIKFSGYSIPVKNNPWEGIELPAFERSFDSIIFLKSSNDILPKPISSIVPVIARTILRRNLSAFIVKINFFSS